ncbi:MAG: menaquinone biosynthetic enzyme MqnA/MqnD family protein [Longimicrobiales bacterium]
MTLRLGHIAYSNCLPVHASLIDGAPPPGIVVVTDVPSRLNDALARGEIDVAPCSSIEYARHDDYRILPDLTIASDGPVQSILLESRVAPAALDGKTVLLPTASATSVVLLRILLEVRLGVRPRYQWFDQAAHADPFAAGGDAALWIGDVALRRSLAAGRSRLDLGEAWTEWTGLPFAFAVWQTRAPARRDAELRLLHRTLLASRQFFQTNAAAIAERQASRFGLPPDRLLRYWHTLRYSLDARVEQGLLRFYELALRLGEARPVAGLRYVPAESDARSA